MDEGIDRHAALANSRSAPRRQAPRDDRKNKTLKKTTYSTDISHMNISNGLSIIQSPQKAGKNVYIWPKYTENSIQPVRPVTKKTNSNIYYSKPPVEKREELLNHIDEYQDQSYTQKGKSHSSMPILTPGSFFDARA